MTEGRAAVAVVAALLAFVAAWLWVGFGTLPWGGLEVVPILAVPLLMQTGAWRRWVALLSHREPATGLAVLRIVLGVCVVYILVEMMVRGVVEPLWVDKAYGGYRSIGGTWLVKALGGPTPEVVWSLVAFMGVAAAALALGVGGRITALLVLVPYQGLTELNAHAGGSYDEVVENGLWLLFLSPSMETLSLTTRLRTGSWTSEAPVPAWPRYLAVGQLVLIYWTTGLQKVSAHWTPGGEFSALYYIFQQPTWQRFDMTWVAWLYPLTQIGTAVTWFWEVLAPLWLLAFWYRATRTRPGWLRAQFNAWNVRTAYAAVGLLFHVLIFVFMDVGPFGFVTLAFYACLFHADEYAAAWSRLTRRRATRSGSTGRSSDP